jgi:hypothetical protein
VQLQDLAFDEHSRVQMAEAVVRWHKPQAAEQIAESMLILMQNLHGPHLARHPGHFSGTETVMA